MTIVDKVSAKGRSIIQKYVDQEPANYIEAGLVHQIILTGRFHVATMSLLYNHAQDAELRKLIKDVIDNITEKTIEASEDFFNDANAQIPTIKFTERHLEDIQNIPESIRYTDQEIVIMLADMHTSANLALLMAINQSYNLDLSLELRKQLNLGLEWGYRLLELSLHRGWLPEIAKVNH